MTPECFIDGKWITGSGAAFAVSNPATQKVLHEVKAANSADINAAISAAHRAFADFKNSPAAFREDLLLKAAAWMAKHEDEVANALISESGSSFGKAHFEVHFASDILRAAAGEARRVFGQLQHQEKGEMHLVHKAPLGPVLGIAPFNFPLVLAIKKVAFAIAAGCTFVLKPSSLTPASGVYIARALEAAGAPAGVINLIQGPGSIADELIDDARIKFVAFTGSSVVGKKIASRAAGLFKKYSLELGGKNPLIVLKDFDVKKAAKIAAFGAFFHQGQICMCTSRIIVEEPIYEDFCAELSTIASALKPGDPTQPSTIIGPLIKSSQCALIDEQIAQAQKEGAKILCGGKHEGNFYEPTVLKDVLPSMKIFYHESFGPVTSLVKARDRAHALEICNDNDYGLSSAVLTNNFAAAFDLALNIEAGMVHVNGPTVADNSLVPFGGIKQSGIGREGGAYSIDEFCELKWISLHYEEPRLPF